MPFSRLQTGKLEIFQNEAIEDVVRGIEAQQFFDRPR